MGLKDAGPPESTEAERDRDVIYIYIYICTCIYIYMYVYIYIYFFNFFCIFVHIELLDLTGPEGSPGCRLLGGSDPAALHGALPGAAQGVATSAFGAPLIGAPGPVSGVPRKPLGPL